MIELERLFTTNPICPCVWLYNSLQPVYPVMLREGDMQSVLLVDALPVYL